MSLSFAQIQHAWHVQDPSLVDKLCQLAGKPDATPQTPTPDDELTFERFLDKAFSHSFREQHAEVQFAQRIAMIATLEADECVYPLPERYKIHLILIALWEDSCENNSAYSRAILQQAIDALPLSYGVWKGLKRIYKQAEFMQDYEIFGQITAKIDLQRFDKSARTPVSVATKTYMSLRAWRYLRRLGQQMPMGYIDAAVQVLASFDEHMKVGSPAQTKSWVLNHICFHHSLDYGVNRFHNSSPRKLFNAKGRAFSEAWQRDSAPLIRLLATAKNEAIRQFATDSLKHDFKTQLRDVDAPVIQYLSAGYAHSQARDEMIVWLLETSPHFEKSKFHETGLHQVVVKLLHSHYSAAFEYAISYAKSYAPDLALSELMLLAIAPFAAVRQFAIDTILSRDPLKDVGVTGWGQLLDTDYHHDIASKQLSRHFTRHDLTLDWFFARLTSNRTHSVTFAIKKLPELYSARELGQDYFIRLGKQLDLSRHDESVMAFILGELRRLDLSHVDAEIWQYFLLHPYACATISAWINADFINAAALNMDYWHALAYEPDWRASPYIEQLKSANNSANEPTPKQWQTQLAFDEDLAVTVRAWLADVRRFAPVQLGFDWLMTLASGEQALYREFAIGRINKGFLPADFVAYYANNDVDGITDNSADKSSDVNNAAKMADTVDSNDSDVDLAGQKFLFTGKMQSMTRGEAEKLVKAANGAISSAINGKLDYLVIGDDGSPLYGNGRKGSKQLKAEDVIASGAALKIVSETAFLQMLTGQARTVSTDETLAGSEALWQMAVADPNAPISELALSYLSHHHEHICMALTDRPVDPDAIIPAEFFSAARIIPLLQHNHNRLRDFGLLIAEYELASWQPTPALWLTMAESSHAEVTGLLKRALLDAPTAANRRYHVAAEQLNAQMLDAFINSKKQVARQLGITLLQRYSQFQNIDSLYRLTQSHQRDVRYAALTMLWQHYKARHTPPNWQPASAYIDSVDNEHTKNDKVKGKANKVKDKTANKAQQPSGFLSDVPADFDQLLLLLRQSLFELPPGRLASVDTQKRHASAANNAHNSDKNKAKPISASRAKLALIETFRDVALANPDFAALIMPPLYTFTHSAGKMERHACLVAVTRLLSRYPSLAEHLQSVALA